MKRPIAKEETKRSLGANVAGGVEGRLLLLEVVGDEHVEGEHQAEGLGRGLCLRKAASSNLKEGQESSSKGDATLGSRNELNRPNPLGEHGLLEISLIFEEKNFVSFSFKL